MIKKSIVVVFVPPSFCGKDYQDDKEKYCCGKWAGSTLPEHLRFLHHSILYIISVIIAVIITVIINVIILYIISVIIAVIINVISLYILIRSIIVFIASATKVIGLLVIFVIITNLIIIFASLSAIESAKKTTTNKSLVGI